MKEKCGFLEEKVLTLPAEESVRLLSAIAAIHRGLGERRQAERVWNAAIEIRMERCRRVNPGCRPAPGCAGPAHVLIRPALLQWF